MLSEGEGAQLRSIMFPSPGLIDESAGLRGGLQSPLVESGPLLLSSILTRFLKSRAQLMCVTKFSLRIGLEVSETGKIEVRPCR